MPLQQGQRLSPATARGLLSAILASAAEAAWKAFVLLVLGRVAVSILSGIFQDMTPSLPPSFEEAEATTHSQHHWHVSSWLRGSAFYGVFAVFFAGILWSRLRGPVTEQSGARSRRLQKIQRVLRDNWFGVIVGNAFGAMIAAAVAVWLQRFSWVQWLLHELLQLILPAVHQAVLWLFSERLTHHVDSWFAWYGQNQAKFNFWFIYFAAICDDLGIPNIKTLARGLFRRTRKVPIDSKPSVSPPSIPASF